MDLILGALSKIGMYENNDGEAGSTGKVDREQPFPNSPVEEQNSNLLAIGLKHVGVVIIFNETYCALYICRP